MPFDGNGNYSPPAGTEGTSGEVIDSSDYNAFIADLTAALSSLLRRAGDSAMTGNLPMGGNRITGLASGIGDTDAVSKLQMDTILEAFETSVENTLDTFEASLTEVPITTSELTEGATFSTSSNVTLNTGLTVGRVYEIYNSSGSAAIQIIQGSGVTLRYPGSQLTGTRTLEPYGLAFIKVIATNVYLVSGPGVA